ncbi:MAG: SLC13 family permease [Verrucomicrobiota bacterium]
MNWEIIVVLIILVAALVSFVLEKVSVDVTAFSIFGLLILVGILAPSESWPSINSLVSVFANPAPLTIAAMFIISVALEKCGAIEMMAQRLGKLTALPYGLFIFVMAIGVGGVSAFMNNTPVVVVFMPVIISLARKMDTPASKLLIPLSYLSIFGGICTLMGTSTNILMSGIIKDFSYAGEAIKPLGMFELAAVGVPLMVIGTLYLALFGKRLLPKRETLTAILSEEERKEYITEAYVKTGSDLDGKSFGESGLKRTRGIRLVEVIRDGVALRGELRKATLKAGDRLVLSCRPNAIAKAREAAGIDFAGERGIDLEPIAAHEGAIVEGVIGPMSTIVGKTIREINFRQRYRMVILAVHRRGRNVREKLETLPLDFGDTLLMMGTDKAIENLRSSDDLILLDRPQLPAKDMRRRIPLVIGIIAVMIGAVTFAQVPIFGMAALAVTVLLLTGTVKPKDAYAAIEWRILVLIYSMLALGLTLYTTGATDLASSQLLALANWFPESMRPLIMLAVVYLMTNILTELLSNNATVVLMAPIAVAVGDMLGVDPRPFIIAACVASSASFTTPIGYQTNTYVYGVGGYRFGDFAKIGIPLNFLYFIGSIVIIPFFWAF